MADKKNQREEHFFKRKIQNINAMYNTTNHYNMIFHGLGRSHSLMFSESRECQLDHFLSQINTPTIGARYWGLRDLPVPMSGPGIWGNLVIVQSLTLDNA